MSTLTEEKSPRIFDYLAAGILANGLVYFWQIILSFMPELKILSILIFCAVGFVVSWFVVNRTSKQHLKVGAIAGVVSWVITVLMMLGRTEDSNLFFIIIFCCFLVGGLGAAYYSLRQKLGGKAKDLPSLAPGSA